MRTQEERIDTLHKRAEKLTMQKRYRSLAICWGSVSACLVVALVVCMSVAGGLIHDTADAQMSGSSLLSDGVGGYVLIAVLAFFAGVILTAVIYRYRRRKTD